MFFLSAINTFNVLQALYTAFFSLGVLQFVFTLIANAPYLIALGRMAWHRDSEYRRKVLYTVCYHLYELQLGLDLWTLLSLEPNTDPLC